MSLDQAKRLYRHLENMFNTPDIQIVDTIFAPHFVAHVPMMPTLNRSSFKAFIQSFYTPFPDLSMCIDEKIITSKRLILRVTYSGTHRDSFLGLEATHLQITLPTISVFRVEQGWITEGWMEMDIFGLVGQISSVHIRNLPTNLN